MLTYENSCWEPMELKATKLDHDRRFYFMVATAVLVVAVMVAARSMFLARSEFAVQRAENVRNSTLLANIPGGVCTIDARTGIVLSVNPGWERNIAMRSASQMVGRSYVSLLPRLARPWHRRFLNNLPLVQQELSEGKMHVGDAAILLPSGEVRLFQMDVYLDKINGHWEIQIFADPRNLVDVPEDDWEPTGRIYDDLEQIDD